ncbi:MAG: hypothetical protein GWO38_32790, partial [Phycisphaerae bacterium]|nr:hypothetical protein [Phycisphaerae bacterium]NIX32272.1 hypothetical protein [Phycisphaerae bacterium]
TFAGGALHFAHYYNEIDFRDDPPNVTFAGYHDGVEGEKFTIFELGSPVIRDKNIVFPVMEWIGIEKAVATGDFTNVSLIVDNVVGDFFETVAAGLGTAAACSIGEVATAGAATAACAAAVIGTAGFIANKA